MTPGDSEVDAINLIDDLVHDALIDGPMGALSRLLSCVDQDAPVLDAVTTGLLEMCGIVPAAALAIHALFAKDGRTILVADKDHDRAIPMARTTAQGSGGAVSMTWRVRVDADAEIEWDSMGILWLPRLPMALVAAMTGRPVGDVVDHPGLQGRDLTIERAWSDDEGTAARIADWSAIAAKSMSTIREMETRRRHQRLRRIG